MARSITDTTARIARPADPYSPLWGLYWEQNPHLHRSVGSAGADDQEAAAAAAKAAADAAAAEEAKKAADAKAAKEAADKKAADDADAKRKADDDAKKKSSIDDEKAALVKEVMQKKERAEKAEAARLATLEKIAKAFGVKPEEVESHIAKLEADEEKKLAAAGDFEKLKERLIEQHQAALKATKDELNGKLGDTTKKLSEAQKQIRTLMVTNQFANSKFLQENILLTPAKAERLFGDHFKVEEGEGGILVTNAYTSDGKPLLDKDGKKLPFDEALKEIVDADPDRDTLYRAKGKGGAGSGILGSGKAELPEKDAARGRDRIKAALAAAKK